MMLHDPGRIVAQCGAQFGIGDHLLVQRCVWLAIGTNCAHHPTKLRRDLAHWDAPSRITDAIRETIEVRSLSAMIARRGCSHPSQRSWWPRLRRRTIA